MTTHPMDSIYTLKKKPTLVSLTLTSYADQRRVIHIDHAHLPFTRRRYDDMTCQSRKTPFHISIRRSRCVILKVARQLFANINYSCNIIHSLQRNTNAPANTPCMSLKYSSNSGVLFLHHQRNVTPIHPSFAGNTTCGANIAALRGGKVTGNVSTQRDKRPGSSQPPRITHICAYTPTIRTIENFSKITYAKSRKLTMPHRENSRFFLGRSTDGPFPVVNDAVFSYTRINFFRRNLYFEHEDQSRQLPPGSRTPFITSAQRVERINADVFRDIAPPVGIFRVSSIYRPNIQKHRLAQPRWKEGAELR